MSGNLTPVDGGDFVAVARGITATIRNIYSLRSEQRHGDAEGLVFGLRRLANTIRATQADHGFIADLVLGPELAAIDSVLLDFS